MLFSVAVAAEKLTFFNLFLCFLKAPVPHAAPGRIFLFWVCMVEVHCVEAFRVSTSDAPPASILYELVSVLLTSPNCVSVVAGFAKLF